MKKLYTLLLICAAGTGYSQQGFGTSNPAPSSVIEMVASNKGALLPRIALTSTAVAAPVTSPANALTVFNTATTGDVTPGYYYWSTAGSKWIRMTDASAATTVSNTVSGGSVSTTVNGVTGTAVAIPNALSSSANTLSSTVAGGTAQTANIINTNLVTNPTANTIGTTINGVASTANATIIGSNALSLSANSLTSNVNGVTGSQSLSGLTLAGDATGTLAASTVSRINGSPLGTTTGASTGQVLSWNGSAWAPANVAPATTTHTLSNATNTITSVVNGVSATAPAVNTVSNTVSGGNVSTTVNGVAGTAVAIPNTFTTTGNTVSSTVAGGTAQTVTVPNIYTANGSLTGNRTVTQGANTLAFTSTATNGFSVDGSTFSVDAANNRVGIGTSSPTAIANILTPTAGDTVDALQVGIDNCGGLCAQGTARNLVLYNNNSTNSLFASLVFVPSRIPTSLEGASILGIDRDATNNTAGISIQTRNTGTGSMQDRLVVKSTGNVGIGTSSPSTALHINSASSGAFRLQDTTEGAGKYMISDANGVGTWQSVQALKTTALGTFPGSTTTVSSDGGAAPKYSQVYIDLTQGRWIVNAGLTIRTTNVISRFWLHCYLSSSSTSIAQANFTHLGPAGNNTSYAGTLTNSGDTSDNRALNFLSGSSLINVTAATARIYLLIENEPNNYWTYVTGNYENYFYAIPVN